MAPGLSQLLHARVARCLCQFEEGAFCIKSLTLYTVTFDYAGVEIRYRRNEDRIKRTPKRLPGNFSEEDVSALNSLAHELLVAYKTGTDALNEKRKEEAEFRRRCKEQEHLHELANDPQDKLPLETVATTKTDDDPPF